MRGGGGKEWALFFLGGGGGGTTGWFSPKLAQFFLTSPPKKKNEAGFNLGVSVDTTKQPGVFEKRRATFSCWFNRQGMRNGMTPRETIPEMGFLVAGFFLWFIPKGGRSFLYEQFRGASRTRALNPKALGNPDQ